MGIHIERQQVDVGKRRDDIGYLYEPKEPGEPKPVSPEEYLQAKEYLWQFLATDPNKVRSINDLVQYIANVGNDLRTATAFASRDAIAANKEAEFVGRGNWRPKFHYDGTNSSIQVPVGSSNLFEVKADSSVVTITETYGSHGYPETKLSVAVPIIAEGGNANAQDILRNARAEESWTRLRRRDGSYHPTRNSTDPAQHQGYATVLRDGVRDFLAVVRHLES